MTPEKTPLEDMRKIALAHYEELSDQAHSWYSDIPNCINFYYDYKKAGLFKRILLLFK